LSNGLCLTFLITESMTAVIDWLMY
jgi:hypothetical protein